MQTLQSAEQISIDPQSWPAVYRTVPPDSASRLSDFAARNDLSFECTLVGAWSHLISCYGTADPVVIWTCNNGPHKFQIPAKQGQTVREFLREIEIVFEQWELRESRGFTNPGQDFSFVFDLTGCTHHPASETQFSVRFDSTKHNARMAEMLAGCILDILDELPAFELRSRIELPFLSGGRLETFTGCPHDVMRMDGSVLIHESIDQRGRTSHEAIAAIYGEEQVTFGALNARANQIARYLQKRGCGPETVIAVHLNRSIDLLVALLGILKSGAAFLPLDGSLPEGRVQSVVEESDAFLILTGRRWSERFAEWSDRVICVDDQKGEWQSESDESVPFGSGPENLAYVTFTSGSTGKPKGVMIEHRNLMAFTNALDHVLGSTPGVYLASTNISFDIAVVELLWTLSRGFKVILYEGDEGLPIATGPRSLAAQIIKHGVTHLQGTPSLMQILMADDSARQALQRLQKVFLGGEPFPPALASKLLDCVSGEVINAYGPTETTIASTFHVVRQVEKSIPIGRPLLNTLCYVLDEAGRLLPPMAPGELFIGGASVARGYLHRSDLTAERFSLNPFDGTGIGRLYRTGDLVRLRLNGDLEFIDRVDSQVKIRGYRIELGEIESVIESFPGVNQAAVVVKQDSSGQQALIGYYATGKEGPISQTALRDHLARLLPSYMVPSVLRQLQTFPLTSNGKVDRGKLAKLELRPNGAVNKLEPRAQRAISASANTVSQDPRIHELEAALCTWCQELLGMQRVDPLDDFFEIGGQSLIAAQLAQKITRQFEINVRLSEFVKARSMRLLARTLLQTKDSTYLWSPVLHLQKSAGKPPLFLLAGLGGNAINFDLISRFIPGRGVYGVETHGMDENGEVLLNIEDMARCYLRAIKSAEPNGPYHLVGYSFGGTLAFAIAQQLLASDEQVGMLGLLDTAEWNYTQGAMASLALFERLNFLYGGTLRELIFGPNRKETLRKRVKATLENYKLARYARSGRQATAADASTEHRNYFALKNYLPKIYRGQIHLFRCGDSSPLRKDPSLGWDQLCENVLITHVPGEHERLLSERPVVEALGKCLHNSLEESDSKLAANSRKRVSSGLQKIPVAS